MSDDQSSPTSDSQDRHGGSKPRRWRPQFGLWWLFWLALLIAIYAPMLQLPHDAMWLFALWPLGTVTVVTVLMNATKGGVLVGAILGAVVVSLPFAPLLVAIIETSPNQEHTSTQVFMLVVLLGSQGFGIGGGIHAIVRGYRRVGYTTVALMFLSFILFLLFLQV